MSNEKVDFLVRQNDYIKQLKAPWLNIWQQLTDYVMPRRPDMYMSPANPTKNQGRTKAEKLYDGTAAWCNEQLAAGLHGNLTSPTQHWQDIITEDARDMRTIEAKNWLRYATDTAYNIFNSPKTFFNQQIHELYLDVGCYGTAAMGIDEDLGHAANFKTHHLSDVGALENNKGAVDCVHRNFSWSVRQAYQEWGERLPKKLLEIYNKGKELNRQFEFVHAVFPRDEYGEEFGIKTMDFASVYMWVEGKEIIGEGGYNELPVMVPRWSKITGEIYGRGPGLISLPDNKMLQAIMKVIISGAQKVVDPPLMVPNDGFMLPIVTVPGGLNYYEAVSGGPMDANLIKPLITGGKVDIGFELISKIRDHIMRCFYVDWLQMREGPEMTATEVMQRVEERMRLMSPMIGRLQSELLGPMIERVFNILVRQRRLPPPPMQLQGARLKIDYTSPVVKAQKMTQAISVERLFNAVAPLANAKPEIIDKFNGDRTVDYLADVFDAPPDILNNDKELKVIRSARQKATTEEKQTSDLERLAVGMRNVAPIMKAVQEGRGAQTA